MGAYSPAPVITSALQQRILKEIIEPTIQGMAQEGHPYRGFLYAGLMITPQGDPYVLEFNCRLGDPETQPILLRLQSDLVELCLHALDGNLQQTKLLWDSRVALGVVMVAQGYPLQYPTGELIHGLAAETDNCKIFHAGTALRDGEVITAGGRVLCVTTLADTVCDAQQSAYAMVKQIRWEHCYYRSDIGYRAVMREKQKV
jgi:phosphoribosylamine--glycine ligase